MRLTDFTGTRQVSKFARRNKCFENLKREARDEIGMVGILQRTRAAELLLDHESVLSSPISMVRRDKDLI